MDTARLSKGTRDRLKRIEELKKYTTEQALEFAISIGWLAAEKQAKELKLKELAKEINNGPIY